MPNKKVIEEWRKIIEDNKGGSKMNGYSQEYVNGLDRKIEELEKEKKAYKEALKEIKTYLKMLPTSTNMIIYEIIQKALKS